MAKSPVLSDLTTQHQVMAALNTNNQRIETAFENTLSLDGSTPNAMQADFDMNGNDILNVGTIRGSSIEIDSIDLSEVTNNVGSQRLLAEAAAYIAIVQSSLAEGYAVQVEELYDTFNDSYLGPKGSDPVVDNDGDPLEVGTLYFSTSENDIKVWNGSFWQLFNADVSIAALRANNLSDLADSDEALLNLGLSEATRGFVKGVDEVSARTALNLQEVTEEAALEASEGNGVMTPRRTQALITSQPNFWQPITTLVGEPDITSLTVNWGEDYRQIRFLFRRLRPRTNDLTSLYMRLGNNTGILTGEFSYLYDNGTQATASDFISLIEDIGRDEGQFCNGVADIYYPADEGIETTVFMNMASRDALGQAKGSVGFGGRRAQGVTNSARFFWKNGYEFQSGEIIVEGLPL